MQAKIQIKLIIIPLTYTLFDKRNDTQKSS